MSAIAGNFTEELCATISYVCILLQKYSTYIFLLSFIVSPVSICHRICYNAATFVQVFDQQSITKFHVFFKIVFRIYIHPSLASLASFGQILLSVRHVTSIMLGDITDVMCH